MKLQFKALSVTLGLVTLLGVGTSVRSNTTEISQADNFTEIFPDSIELQNAGKNDSDYDTDLEAFAGWDNTHLAKVHFNGRLNGQRNPDVILYSERNLQGRSLDINAAKGDGDYLPGDFSNKVSSILIRRGSWELYRTIPSSSNDLSYEQKFTLGPGTYNLRENNNVVHIMRVGN